MQTFYVGGMEILKNDQMAMKSRKYRVKYDVLKKPEICRWQNNF